MNGGIARELLKIVCSIIVIVLCYKGFKFTGKIEEKLIREEERIREYYQDCSDDEYF